MDDNNISKLLTIREASERVHVSRQTIYTWIRAGKIRPVLTPGGRLRIPEDQMIRHQPEAPEQDIYDTYPIRDISDLDPVRIEQMGTKEKYWFSRKEEHWYWNSKGDEFIFKSGREGTGENWAEKIAAELCELLELPHAQYDLAIYRQRKGVISPKFVPAGAWLRHGNEILPECIHDYQKLKRYHQTQHTVRAVFDILSDEQIQSPPGWSNQGDIISASDIFVGYLLLDVWIANTDRHHENWGLIIFPGDKRTCLAPTFDHASSLGRNVTDFERKERILTRDKGRNMDHYIKKANSAFYSDQDGRRLLSTLESFSQASEIRPEAARYWLDRFQRVSMDEVEIIIRKIPGEEMSEIAKEFAWTVLEKNRQRILAIKQ
jgi:excisionase family DNA binding protein